MVYVEDWQDFVSMAEELYRAAPLQTRFCTKYRHSDGLLVLKVTDDVRCLKYKTDQAADVKKLEKLNALFLSLMARGTDSSPEDLLQPQAAPKGGAGGGKGGGSSGGAGGQPPVAASAAGGGQAGGQQSGGDAGGGGQGQQRGGKGKKGRR